MESIVATLPIAPRNTNEIGYFLQPFTSWILGQFSQNRSIVAINTLGQHASVTDADIFINTLRFLLPETIEVIEDSIFQWNLILDEYIQQGLTDRWILEEERLIRCCPCLKTEVLQESLDKRDTKARHKVYRYTNDCVVCNLCGKETEQIHARCLLLHIPHSQDTPLTWPEYGEKEYQEFTKLFSGRRLLLSRFRTTGLVVRVNQHDYNIDPDFACMLFPIVLLKQGMCIKELVCGHKTIKQAMLAISVSGRLGFPNPKLIVSPYLTIQTTHSTNKVSFQLKDNDRLILRMILALAVGCKSKNISIPPYLFDLIQKTIINLQEIISSTDSLDDIATFRKVFDRQDLIRYLILVSKKQTMENNNNILHAIGMLSV